MLNTYSDLPEQQEPFPRAASMNARSKTVLVVENNESLLMELTRELERRKYLWRSASDSDEGLQLYRRCEPFFAVIVDNNLTEFTVAITEQNPKQRILITALSYDGRPPCLTTISDNIRVLTHLNDLAKELDSLRYWATKDEVDEAIQSLTPEKLLKLRKVADLLASRIQWVAAPRDGRELLQEALLSFFKGSSGETGRRWDKEDGDFASCLFGVLKSIARNWWQHERLERKINRPCEILTCDEDGIQHSLLDQIESGGAIVEDVLILREEIEQIFKTFDGDENATNVLHGWERDMTQLEIMREYKFSAAEFKATVKRIRTLLRRQKGGSINGRRKKLR
jgi:CheY-like chemotaxis protein